MEGIAWATFQIGTFLQADCWNRQCEHTWNGHYLQPYAQPGGHILRSFSLPTAILDDAWYMEDKLFLVLCYSTEFSASATNSELDDAICLWASLMHGPLSLSH